MYFLVDSVKDAPCVYQCWYIQGKCFSKVPYACVNIINTVQAEAIMNLHTNVHALHNCFVYHFIVNMKWMGTDSI